MRLTLRGFGVVDTIVNESSPELHLFSSDYPHAEGGRDRIGRDRIGRFDRSTKSLSDAACGLFFAENYRTLYRAARPGERVRGFR